MRTSGGLLSRSARGNHRRLEAIKEVQAASIDTCITMTPLLLVNSNRDFADALIDTGVEKFIAQPFHFRKGSFWPVRGRRV